MIEYTCPVCGGVVEQEVPPGCLPERTRCPWCADDTERAVEALRRRDAMAREACP